MQVGDLVTFSTLRNQDPPDHQLLGVIVGEGAAIHDERVWRVLWSLPEGPKACTVHDHDIEAISERR